MYKFRSIVIDIRISTIMEDFKAASKKYFLTLKERKDESKIYKPYQLIGLQIADILNDRAHKSLYIKLAKTRNNTFLLSLARRIAERRDIENMGAYFMKMLKEYTEK